jgi:hypothetical protein
MRCKTSFIGKQLVLVRRLSLDISKSSLFFLDIFAAQKDLLENLQYQAANVTIRTKMNIPKCALLAELGWEPINAFLDRQRVSFKHKMICGLYIIIVT